MTKTGSKHDKDWINAIQRLEQRIGKDWSRELAKTGTENWQRLEQRMGKHRNSA